MDNIATDNKLQKNDSEFKSKTDNRKTLLCFETSFFIVYKVNVPEFSIRTLAF